MGNSSAVGYETSDEKDGRRVTGAANRHTRRAGMMVATPGWTNRILTSSAVQEQKETDPKRKKADAKLDDTRRSRSECTRQPPKKKRGVRQKNQAIVNGLLATGDRMHPEWPPYE